MSLLRNHNILSFHRQMAPTVGLEPTFNIMSNVGKGVTHVLTISVYHCSSTYKSLLCIETLVEQVVCLKRLIVARVLSR